jgi:hypothetical protein
MNIEEIKARAEAAAVHEYDGITDLIYGRDVKALIAEMERLTKENEKLIESYKESNLEQATENYELEQKNAMLENDKINADMNLENLTAEVEGLNTINATLKKDKEFCLSTAKYNAEFYDEAKEENATLKKALELACKHISAHEDCLCTQEIAHKECHDWDGNCDEKGCWKDYFIHQAQQTHETQEAEK